MLFNLIVPKVMRYLLEILYRVRYMVIDVATQWKVA